MIIIDTRLLDQVSAQAKSSPRRRKNHNFHKEPADTLQRLLNAIEPLSYVQPHKHENPDKREAFFALRGRIAVIEFDEQGAVTGHTILDPLMGIFGAEVAQCTYHTVIALEEDTVAYEIKDGPYSPIDDKNFASWAPKEGEDGCMAYTRKLMAQLDIE
ncbi:MAG: WbuC family cupin fold metalloprotein [Bacteroidota bacterium]